MRQITDNVTNSGVNYNCFYDDYEYTKSLHGTINRDGNAALYNSALTADDSSYYRPSINVTSAVSPDVFDYVHFAFCYFLLTAFILLA